MREVAQTRETSMNQPSDKAPGNEPGNLPDELRAEAARLRKLADELQAREREHQEMLANYPHFKQAVYAWLREKFEREAPSLPPGKDLKTVAEELGAMPLETFLAQLGCFDKRPGRS